MADNGKIQELVDAVRHNARYRSISEDLVRRVGLQELQKRANFKEAVKSTRSKLHQIGGAYLESRMPYEDWQAQLAALPHDARDPAVRDFSSQVMQKHASTRERFPIREEFFLRTLSAICPVHSVLDLACGLNPLALSWMPLAEDVVYYACDIYENMVSFVGTYLDHCGIENHVSVCDLTSDCPKQEVQVAFLLKTIPCLEQMDKNIGPRLLDEINAEHLLISFPTHSLHGKNKGMVKHYRNHFEELVSGRGWQVRSYQYDEELAFLVSR